MAARNLSQAAADILAERERQRAVEGFTAEHDDAHVDGDIARAAASYAYAAGVSDARRAHLQADPETSGLRWPWDYAWWKSTTRRRDLVKAGALIVAEIERIDRMVQS